MYELDQTSIVLLSLVRVMSQYLFWFRSPPKLKIDREYEKFKIIGKYNGTKRQKLLNATDGKYYRVAMRALRYKVVEDGDNPILCFIAELP